MQVKIQLDKTALDSLFPEGSEARVELQSAVLAEMVKKLAAGKMQAFAEQNMGKVIKEIIGDKNQWNPKLNNWALDLINAEVEKQVGVAVRRRDEVFTTDFINARIDTAVDRSASRLFNKTFDSRVEKYLDNKLAGLTVKLG